MNNIKSYIIENRGRIISEMLMVFAFGAVCLLGDVDKGLCFYGVVVAFSLGIIIHGFRMYKYWEKMRLLKDNKDSVVIDASFLPESKSPMEEMYISMIMDLEKYIKTQQMDFDRERNDQEEYYTMWVHQVKNPIAALKLITDSDFDGPKTQMRIELQKIEQYVEMVLQYIRLESDQSDYVFRKCDLGKLAKNSIKKFSYFFIQKKLTPDVADMKVQVLTDEKWLAFVVEQILSNALKYTAKGKISIYFDGKALVIEDTGIGIREEDIPRVCERGYTGYTGREDKKATGIGLYLCKEILKKLNHEMVIESEVGVGTKVSIVFTEDQVNLTEL